MTIISAWDETAGRIGLESISVEEREEIKKVHDLAMLKDITWAFFGGVVNLGQRHFQVVP